MCLVRGIVGRRLVLGRRRVDRRQVVVASKDQIQQQVCGSWVSYNHLHALP